MRWKKLGCLFAPINLKPWNVTHAANPFLEHLEGDIFRLYYTGRDSENRSHICGAKFDLQTRSVFDIDPQPVISPGDPGIFDDSGTAMGFLLNWNGAKYLYYLGWNLKLTVPWLNTIGLAVSEDGGNTFSKYSPAPIMDRSAVDPFTISYPSILEHKGELKMWYGSNLGWGATQEAMRHVIKTATSRNGIDWVRNGDIAVALHPNGEYAISKPFVLYSNRVFEMWYSYRGAATCPTYRIGYATSSDGKAFERRDQEAGITVSSEGWDSEMICYPFVFDHDGSRYMLYNGNGYGKAGFGLAVLE